MFFFLGPVCAAGEGPDWNADTLTGDWSGIRSGLGGAGFTLEVLLKADIFSNLSGGIKRGTKYLDNWDLKLLVDGGRLLGWSDTTAYFQLIGNHGGRFNGTHVGSFMGVDNIEVNVNTTKMFHAWLERSFMDRRFSFLAGLYPVDSQFYVTDATGLFLHPTGGMAAELAQTGVNGPSIFPTSSLGVRVSWRPADAFYLQVALVDGVPGDPDNPRGTHIRFDRGDGTLAIAESGWHATEAVSKYAVGSWRYTARFDDLVDTDSSGNPAKRVNRGSYALLEQTVLREREESSQGMALFFRYGVASGDVNVLDYSYSLGLRYEGLLPGRGQDEFGIGLTRGHAGAKFRQAAATPLESGETALEVTYRARVVRWLAIQPTVQRIFNPGFDPAVRNAWVAGMRFEIAL